MFRLFQRDAKIPRGIPVTLTQRGKQKADNMGGEGAIYVVLACIAEEQGAATIKEIAEGTMLDEDKVQKIVRQMARAGLLTISDPDRVGQE